MCFIKYSLHFLIINFNFHRSANVLADECWFAYSKIVWVCLKKISVSVWCLKFVKRADEKNHFSWFFFVLHSAYLLYIYDTYIWIRVPVMFEREIFWNSSCIFSAYLRIFVVHIHYNFKFKLQKLYVYLYSGWLQIWWWNEWMCLIIK